MSDTLRIRVYNVRFGDAILVTVPDRDPGTGQTVTRRILIDVGNAPLVASREGGDDEVFEDVVDDILKQLGDDELDLYVMTHEHLDHVQGLPYVAWKIHGERKFRRQLRVRSVWLTASSHPDYYKHHPEAKKKKLEFDAMLKRIAAFAHATGLASAAGLGGYLAVNNPASSSECVEFLRNLNPRATAYVYRGASLAGTHPFKEAKLDVWAPEEDTSDYYGTLLPLAADVGATRRRARGGSAGAALRLVPPRGVDVGAFYRLVDARKSPVGDNMLAIDQAANNTSIVFVLGWRGLKLLFAGDAELKSWRTMHAKGVLEPVDFLKVAHHGSRNGTPDGEIFDAVLPANPGHERKRQAVISTWTNTYPGIPHAPTDARLASRCEVQTTLQDRNRLYFEVQFRA